MLLVNFDGTVRRQSSLRKPRRTIRWGCSGQEYSRCQGMRPRRHVLETAHSLVLRVKVPRRGWYKMNLDTLGWARLWRNWILWQGVYNVFNFSVFSAEHFDQIVLGKNPIYKRNVRRLAFLFFFFFSNQGWDTVSPDSFPQTTTRANARARSWTGE